MDDLYHDLIFNPVLSCWCLNVIKLRKILLVCGMLSSLLYIAMNIFIPMEWANYSCFSQTVSELSAIGAPTRSIWVLTAMIYTSLFAAFGFGVFLSAGNNRSVQITGILIIVFGLIGLGWPPMHLREALAAGEKSVTDTMHIVFAIVTVLLMLLTMGFGSLGKGKGFRVYSIFSIVLLLFFGALTSKDAPLIESNQPTPWVGVWERINIGIFLLWVIIFALLLWQINAPASEGKIDAGMKSAII
jgi:hypothetical protein